ncbi:unnamed protein product [Linum trigynum]|uniref:Uncharacterized protein n=1 Tax=Linum trigynum TaxID=586398 RepID=A0AAV2F6P1_9ROSI
MQPPFSFCSKPRTEFPSESLTTPPSSIPPSPKLIDALWWFEPLFAIPMCHANMEYTSSAPEGNHLWQSGTGRGRTAQG